MYEIYQEVLVQDNCHPDNWKRRHIAGFYFIQDEIIYVVTCKKYGAIKEEYKSSDLITEEELKLEMEEIELEQDWARRKNEAHCETN